MLTEGYKILLIVGIMIAVPGLFLVSLVVVGVLKQKKIATKGRRYTGKILKYVDDYSAIVNGMPQQNICVRYFDRNHKISEAIIPTRFAYGTNKYPIGYTIDFYEYYGRFSWDKKSLSSKSIPGEDELMDAKPIEPKDINYKAIECPSCGATIKVAIGYTAKCSFCGNIVNAK